MSGRSCPACGGAASEPFFALRGLPVHATAVSTSREQAVAQPRGDQLLAVCVTCGFVHNTAFDPSLVDYAGEHAESQGSSPTFRAFADQLAADWVRRWGLGGRPVLEVGCGSRGEFLHALARAGVSSAHGVDPGLDLTVLPSDEVVSGERTVFAPSARSRQAGAVVCRHTLEHVPDVDGFVGTVLAGLGPACRALLFEVPDFGRVLDTGAFWDLHYEHCSNFSATPLAALFTRLGTEVAVLRRVYDEQYLVLEADPVPGRTPTTQVVDLEPVEALVQRCMGFGERAEAQKQRWQTWFSAQQRGGREVVLWGGGSKGSVLLNALPDLGVQRVVDINPRLQGGFLAGSGVPIVAPEQLRHDPPAAVVLMNPVYLDEVRRMLDELGLHDVELSAV